MNLHFTELEAATDEKKIEITELLFQLAENRLSSEIRQIESPNPTHDLLKETLLSRARTLEKQADSVIKKLKADQKNTALIEKEVAVVKNLIKELQEAKSGTNVRHIEYELDAAEVKLALELRRIHKYDAEAAFIKTLIKRTEIIEKQAKEIIAKLKAEKKDAEVAIVEKDLALVETLAKELQAATPTDNLHHIEDELILAESRLNAELRKANISPDHPNYFQWILFILILNISW